MFTEGLLDLLWMQTWQVALTATCVCLLCRKLTVKRPHIAHALWLLVLLKAVTPPIWSSPVSAFSWITSEQRSNHIGVISESYTVLQPRGAGQLVNQGHVADSVRSKQLSIREDGEVIGIPKVATLDWLFASKMTLALVWLSGIAIGLTSLCVRYSKLLLDIRRSKKESTPELEDLVNRLCRRIRIKRRVELQVINEAIGPVVLGLFYPRIVIPLSIVRELSDLELEFLITHELIHLRRGDLYWAILQMLATKLLWFHPLVHLANGRVGVESEHSCDVETIQLLDCQAMDYARCLVKVLNHKHQLKSMAALPGVRPVEITSTRLERVMKLRHGSYRKLPLLTWAVIVIGCVVVLPGAGLITAQEPDEKLASPKPAREDDYKVEAQPLPFMDGPFGKFQRSQQALIKQGQADKKQKLQVQTTIYALPQTPSVRFADFWSTFRNWDENETGLAQGLRDSTKRMSLVYNNPVRYRVIESESDQQVLRSVNGVNFESKEVIQSTLMTGESTRVQQSDKAKFLVAMLKVDGRPDEDRYLYRHFETGFDLGLQISVTNDGGYSVYSSFYFHDVENPTPAEQKQILNDSDFIPPKPSVVTKIVTCKVDFARNEKVALLVRDVKQKPYLAIIECEPESNPKSESATTHASDESELTKRPKHKATDGLFVFTCNGDDPDDLEGSRTINYFGDELTVTKSVTIEKSNGWTTLRGKQVRWLKKGQELISADSGVFKIKEDGTSFEIALQGNARSWRDETTLHEADRIVSTWSDVAASDQLQGNAKVTNSRPLYENEDYQFPDVSADCIRFELSGSSNDVVCSGNVTVVQKSTSSEPMVTRADKVRLVPETEIRGLSTKVKIQVIDP